MNGKTTKFLNSYFPFEDKSGKIVCSLHSWQRLMKDINALEKKLEVTSSELEQYKKCCVHIKNLLNKIKDI